MGFGNPNDGQNPPVPLQGHGQDAFPTREGGTVDGGQVSPADHNSSGPYITPLPYVSPPVSSVRSVHGTHQYYPSDPRIGNNLMTGVIRHNHLQSPQINTSFSILGGGLRKVDACSSGLQNKQVSENVMPIQSSTAGDYPKNVRMGEAEGSNMNWSQVTQSSLNLGCGAYMSHQNTNSLQNGVDNNIKVGAFHAGKVDGSFLTLGIGSNSEARAKLTFDPQEIGSKPGEAVGPKSSSSYVQHGTSVYPNLTSDFSSFNSSTETRTKLKFDPREIASKLEEAVGPKSSSSHFQPTSSVYPNLTNDFSSFYSNPVAFIDPVSNLGAWTAPLNDDGAMQAATVGMISDPYFSPHLPGAFKQRNFFENTRNNTGFLATSIGGHSTPQSYTNFQCGPSPTSFPLNNTYSCLPQSGYTRPSESASQHMWITTQPTRDLLGISHSRNTGDVSSSFGYDSSKVSGSSVTKDYLGISMFPLKANATQAADSGTQSTSTWSDGQLSSADKVHSAPDFGNSMLPEKMFLQMAESSANKPATGAPFPRRLGVQFNDSAAPTQSSNQSLLSMNVGVQTRSNVHQSQNSKPPQHAKYPLVPISGHHQSHLPAQPNLQRPSLSTDQVLPNTKAGGPSQVYDRSPLKRRASQPSVLVPWGEKRRLVTLPRHPKMSIPPSPSTPAHIRWEGFDSPPPPEPSGHRCLICKSDLAFAPDGLVLQPGNLPGVAVLPCGHTFHEHCLQNITPEDQAHDPPCIPCAIGET